MGEIDDTKPIESVQAAISLFGEKCDLRKSWSSRFDEMEKEKQLAGLQKELANLKVQMEAKDYAHKQALVRLDHYQKVADNLENELLEKSEFVYLLKLELQEANEQNSCFLKAASDAFCELEQLKAERELQERKIFDQAENISLLESEVMQVKKELSKTKEDLIDLNITAEQMNAVFDKAKSEPIEIRAKDAEAQVEIALLKSELHKGSSKLATAEIRASTEKSALHLALQRLASEADETKRENQHLKDAAEDSNGLFLQNLPNKSSIYIENVKSVNRDTDDHVMVSRNEYQDLMKKFEQDLVDESKQEIGILKKELETATAKISELRTRAEQAMSRAEAAEKAKVALEEKISRRREQRERRKAALSALSEVSLSKDANRFDYGNTSKTYQSLGKVLNMKF